MGSALFTIGYARFSLDKFLETLESNGISAVVDVRALPHISHFDSYKRENIKQELAKRGIVYKFFGKLLGARPEDPVFYTKGKVDFAKIKAAQQFQDMCANLKTAIEKGFTPCLMCAQNDPVICHRSILISRYFSQTFPEIPVFHIMPGSLETQAELDQRVLKLYQSARYEESLLGCGPKDAANEMEAAYLWQGEQIAYRPRKPETNGD